MATIDEVLDRMARLMAQPLWVPLNKETRLQFVSQAISHFGDRIRFTRQPILVKNLVLSVSAGVPRYPLPADFVSLYHVSSLRDGYYHEVELAGATEGEFFDTEPRTAGDSPLFDWVTSVVVMGSAPAAYLYTSPTGVSDTLSVWYRFHPDPNPLLADDVPLPEQFHASLIPVTASLMALGQAAWFAEFEGDPERSAAAMAANAQKRADLLDPGNPFSLINWQLKEEDTFERAIHDTQGVSGPEQRLRGFGISRHIRRGMVR